MNGVHCWRYALPNTHHFEGWAVAHVDSAGFLGIVSDYGNYGHLWPWAEGIGDFRQFLVSCRHPGEQHYLMSKLGPMTTLDRAATVESFQDAMQERQADGSMDVGEATECREALKNFADDPDIPEQDLHDAMVIHFSDAWELFCYTFDPQLQAFMRQVWPRLVAVIQWELAREWEGSA